MVGDGYIYTWIPTTAAAAGMRPKDREDRYIYSLRVLYHVETFIRITVHGHVDQLMAREDSVRLISPAPVTMQPAAMQMKYSATLKVTITLFSGRNLKLGGGGAMIRLPLILVNKIIFSQKRG